MQYLLIILSLISVSCELFVKENEEQGICVFYELVNINDNYINDYNCWNGVTEAACNGSWYSNQSCEEFCEKKITEENVLCNVY